MMPCQPTDIALDGQSPTLPEDGVGDWSGDVALTALDGREHLYRGVLKLSPGGRPRLAMEAVAEDEIARLLLTPLRRLGLSRPGGGVEIVEAMRCFAPETQVITARGARAAGALVPGDRVLTRDNGFQPLIWTGRSRQPVRPDTRPVRIAAGTFGPGLPERDLCVSASHRVIVPKMRPGGEETLVPAGALVGRDGVRFARMRDAAVEYVHLQCARHEILFAHGMGAETLLPGDQSLLALLPGLAAWVAARGSAKVRAAVRRATAERATARPLDDDAALAALLGPRGRRPRG